MTTTMTPGSIKPMVAMVRQVMVWRPEVKKGHEEHEEERGRDDRYHRNHVAAHFGQLIINWPLSHRTLWWVRKPLSVHAWTTLFK